MLPSWPESGAPSSSASLGPASPRRRRGDRTLQRTLKRFSLSILLLIDYRWPWWTFPGTFWRGSWTWWGKRAELRKEHSWFGSRSDCWQFCFGTCQYFGNQEPGTWNKVASREGLISLKICNNLDWERMKSSRLLSGANSVSALEFIFLSTIPDLLSRLALAERFPNIFFKSEWNRFINDQCHVKYWGFISF